MDEQARLFHRVAAPDGISAIHERLSGPFFRVHVAHREKTVDLDVSILRSTNLTPDQNLEQQRISQYLRGLPFCHLKSDVACIGDLQNARQTEQLPVRSTERQAAERIADDGGAGWRRPELRAGGRRGAAGRAGAENEHSCLFCSLQ